MLPVIERDITQKYHLMDKETFMEYATLSQTLPGVIALNCASFVGRQVAGFAGMMAAAIGATISAFVIMIAATIAIQLIPQTGPMLGAMSAIRAASAALVLSAAFSLGAHNLKSLYSKIAMASAFVLVFIFKISTPIVVLLAAVAGIVFYGRFKAGGEGKVK